MKKIILEKVINLVREQLATGAPTNNVGSGNIAGTPEADPGNPPVNLKKKKRKPTPLGRYRTRVTWMQKDESK
jgi:hypothetical protein|tara:strand:- start:1036 stop:1254 length:219 start_codon:yes stop_codon:yes gene_type:complete